MWTLRLPARSSDQPCLVSGFCSSGRDFAPRFLQTVPRGPALALRSCFTSIRLHRGLSPPGCWTCPAHIGIGGPLTRPPLPHHRAYGSVPRRFGGLSVYQLFHGEEAQTGEASFGEGAMQSFRGAQPPGSLRAEDSRTGQPFGDLEAAKVPISPAARLPLDPNDASQSPSDPAVE